MRKLKFVFGSHCHQPIGNFDFIFEKALTEAYEPFFRALAGYPEIRMSAHFSGCLLEWVEEHRPEFIALIDSLVKAGRLEMLGGGFYEPVLAAIPERDRFGQLRLMDGYLEDRFGVKPKGAWMTERVWEPQVVSTLLSTGIGYVVIDDFHFKCAGLREEELDGYYVTENDGLPLAVFPINEALRYTIPFADPQKTVDYLRAAYDAGKRAVTMMDDGEKFGLWPGTHKLCYEEGWLRRFFEMLQANADWLESALPSEVLGSLKPTGIVYLPTASYFEMSEWALPAGLAAEFADITHELRDSGRLERYRPFLRGGIWRNFFSKYPEANNMHKRMLAVSGRLERLRVEKGDSPKLRKALRELYRSQCNCAYWHGVFGGLYLPHLRDAVYRHLLEAEIVADSMEFGKGKPPESRPADINLDGYAEPQLQSRTLKAVFTPAYGGAMFELDFLPLRLNLLDTLASRPEGYHSAFSSPITAQAEQSGGDTPSIHDIARRPDDNLKAALRYDWHHRYSLLDHCLHPSATLAAMRDRTFRELGDFVNQPYEAAEAGGGVVLKRSGALYTDEGIFPLIIEKRAVVVGGGLEITYTLSNTGDREVVFLFAPEFNFSMLSGDDKRIRYVAPELSLTVPRLNSAGEIEACSDFAIEDSRDGIRIVLKLDKPAKVWYYPVQTVSQSESGFELNYQSSAILPVLPVALGGGAAGVYRIVLSVLPMRNRSEE